MGGGRVKTEKQKQERGLHEHCRQNHGRLGTVFSLPVDMIDLHPNPVRKVITPNTLEQLAQDILEHDLIHPVVVVRNRENGRFRIVAGQRRYLAVTTHLKWKTIPCTEWSEIDGRAELVMQIAENRQREGLCAVELAFALKDLYGEVVRCAGGRKRGAWSVMESMVGISRSYRTRIMAVFKLNAEAVKLLEVSLRDDGLHRPGAKHIEAVLKLKNTGHQLEVIGGVLWRGLTVTDTQEMVRKKLGLPPKRSLRLESSNDDELRAKLEAELAKLDSKRERDQGRIQGEEGTTPGATLTARPSGLPSESGSRKTAHKGCNAQAGRTHTATSSAPPGATGDDRSEKIVGRQMFPRATFPEPTMHKAPGG